MKNTKIFGTILFAGLSILTTHAQEPAPSFTGIRSGEPITLVLSPAENNSFKVEGDEKAQGAIKTEIKNGILEITNGDLSLVNGEPKVLIGVKNLNSLDITGNTNVNTNGDLNLQDINIESSGAGEVKLNLNANHITTTVSGAGGITLKGTAKLMDASVKGAGSLKAANLITEKANVKVSGAGNAKVNTSQSLDADVSGAGSIIYKGNPAERNVNISGAGSVRESNSGNGEETASDTTRIKLGNKKYVIIDDGDDENEHASKSDSTHDYKDKFKHWQGIDLGVNGYLDYQNSLDIKGADFLELNYSKSIQFGLNLLEKDFHLYKNYVNLVIGAGFDFNHYAFNNNTTIKADTNFIWGFNDSLIDFKKNKLNVSYLKVPLMFEFNTSKNPKRNFHIGVGGEVAYRIHAVTKQKYELDDKHYRIKQKDDFNLEPFRYSAMVRIGYNNVTLFADYGLNRLFKKDQGPQVYPFTVGITLALN